MSFMRGNALFTTNMTRSLINNILEVFQLDARMDGITIVHVSILVEDKDNLPRSSSIGNCSSGYNG